MPYRPTGNPPGNPALAPFEPTDEQRRQVEAMSGYGVPQDDIAVVLGVAPNTLRKYFRTELDRGAARANARVGQRLFEMASSGQNTAATIFWMKARAGWREKQEIDVNLRSIPAAEAPDAALQAVAFGGGGDAAAPEDDPG